MRVLHTYKVSTQAHSFLHDLGASLDAGDEDVIYLDFSKAFDSVSHGKLLHEISLFGIQGPIHALPREAYWELSFSFCT